ncbi:MAG: response regulator transcription factor [Candidatus Aminicenantes bacterium]|jgi:DNA-binding NarL/FixJ family response regulator
MNVTVLLVDDHRMVRGAIKRAIKSFSTKDYVFDPILEAENGVNALEIVKTNDPDVVVLDIVMPGMDGVEVCRKIRKFNQKVKIIMLTMLQRPETILDALDAGIDGYLFKMADLDELQKALEAVIKGDNYFARQITNMLLNRQDRKASSPVSTTLTNREREILSLVISGKTSREIADHLFISYHTVNEHRKHISSKLGVKNVAQLIRYSIINNLV